MQLTELKPQLYDTQVSCVHACVHICVYLCIMCMYSHFYLTVVDVSAQNWYVVDGIVYKHIHWMYGQHTIDFVCHRSVFRVIIKPSKSGAHAFIRKSSAVLAPFIHSLRIWTFNRRPSINPKLIFSIIIINNLNESHTTKSKTKTLINFFIPQQPIMASTMRIIQMFLQYYNFLAQQHGVRHI